MYFQLYVMVTLVSHVIKNGNKNNSIIGFQVHARLNEISDNFYSDGTQYDPRIHFYFGSSLLDFHLYFQMRRLECLRAISELNYYLQHCIPSYKQTESILCKVRDFLPSRIINDSSEAWSFCLSSLHLIFLAPIDRLLLCLYSLITHTQTHLYLYPSPFRDALMYSQYKQPTLGYFLFIETSFKVLG